MLNGALPGSELIEQGLADLGRGMRTIPALLVSMCASRLREVGLDVPEDLAPDPEETLYRLLAEAHGDGAYSKYNALRRRLASFLRAARCAR